MTNEDLSPDGRKLATACWGGDCSQDPPDSSVDVWDLDFTRAQQALDADYDEVDSAGKFTIYRRRG